MAAVVSCRTSLANMPIRKNVEAYGPITPSIHRAPYTCFFRLKTSFHENPHEAVTHMLGVEELP